MSKQLFVASFNPVKLNATKQGLEVMFPDLDFEIQGISVPSGVSDQPISDKETLLGAENRARLAHQEKPEADFWVGIEGGIEDDGQHMLAFAWVVIRAADGQTGRARTGAFALPNEVATLVRAGHELGEADDLVFGSHNSKQKSGAVGLLTGGRIDRTSLYVHAVKLALIPFKNPELSF